MGEGFNPVRGWSTELISDAIPKAADQAAVPETDRNYWEAILPLSLDGHIDGEERNSGTSFVEPVSFSGLNGGKLGGVDFNSLGVNLNGLVNADAMGLSGWELKLVSGDDFTLEGEPSQKQKPEAGDKNGLVLNHEGKRIVLEVAGKSGKRYGYTDYDLIIKMTREAEKT